MPILREVRMDVVAVQADVLDVLTALRLHGGTYVLLSRQPTAQTTDPVMDLAALRAKLRDPEVNALVLDEIIRVLLRVFLSERSGDDNESVTCVVLSALEKLCKRGCLDKAINPNAEATCTAIVQAFVEFLSPSIITQPQTPTTTATTPQQNSAHNSTSAQPFLNTPRSSPLIASKILQLVYTLSLSQAHKHIRPRIFSQLLHKSLLLFFSCAHNTTNYLNTTNTTAGHSSSSSQTTTTAANHSSVTVGGNLSSHANSANHNQQSVMSGGNMLQLHNILHADEDDLMFAVFTLAQEGMLSSLSQIFVQIFSTSQTDCARSDTHPPHSSTSEEAQPTLAASVFSSLCFFLFFHTKHNLSSMARVHTLQLVITCLESLGPKAVKEDAALMGVIAKTLCLRLLQLPLVDVWELRGCLRAVLWLHAHLRDSLHTQIEQFIVRLLLTPFPTMSAPMQEIVLDTFIDLCGDKLAMAELFANYDCSHACSDVFESVCRFLWRSPHPVGGSLNERNTKALECLCLLLASLAQRATSQPSGEMDVEIRNLREIRAQKAKRHAIAETFARSTKRGIAQLQELYEELYPTPSNTDQNNNNNNQNNNTHDQNNNTNNESGSSNQVDHRTETNTNETNSTEHATNENSTNENSTNETNTNETNINTENNDDQNNTKANHRPSREQFIAEFLCFTPNLDKTAIGDYLGEGSQMSNAVLSEFTHCFAFAGLGLDVALRMFLDSFLLPGESQKIARIMEAFADSYCTNNKEPFENTDAAYVTAYSLIMLNTDLHSGQVRHKMTLSQFISNNRNTNNGKTLPHEILESFYRSIADCALALPDMHGHTNEPRPVVSQRRPVITDTRYLYLLLRSQRSDYPKYLHVGHNELDIDMFTLLWAPCVASLSVVFDSCPDSNTYVLNQVIEGFNNCAAMASAHNMGDVVDKIVISLCRSTQLPSTDQHPSQSFGNSFKACLAARAVFLLARTFANHVREGWRNLLSCLVRLHHHHCLAPEGVLWPFVHEGGDLLDQCSDVPQPTEVTMRSNVRPLLPVAVARAAAIEEAQRVAAEASAAAASASRGFFSTFFGGGASSTASVDSSESDLHRAPTASATSTTVSTTASSTITSPPAAATGVPATSPIGAATPLGACSSKGDSMAECLVQCRVHELFASAHAIGNESLQYLARALTITSFTGPDLTSDHHHTTGIPTGQVVLTDLQCDTTVLCVLLLGRIMEANVSRDGAGLWGLVEGYFHKAVQFMRDAGTNSSSNNNNHDFNVRFLRRRVLVALVRVCIAYCPLPEQTENVGRLLCLLVTNQHQTYNTETSRHLLLDPNDEPTCVQVGQVLTERFAASCALWPSNGLVPVLLQLARSVRSSATRARTIFVLCGRVCDSPGPRGKYRKDGATALLNLTVLLTVGASELCQTTQNQFMGAPPTAAAVVTAMDALCLLHNSLERFAESASHEEQHTTHGSSSNNNNNNNNEDENHSSSSSCGSSTSSETHNDNNNDNNDNNDTNSPSFGPVALASLLKVVTVVLTSLTNMCQHSNHQVRMHALLCLRRCTYDTPCIWMPSAQWYFLLRSPLLHQLASLPSAEALQGMPAVDRDAFLAKALDVLAKAFLRQLAKLLDTPDFSSLWLDVLRVFVLFAGSSASAELGVSVQETAKNVLMVMHTSGVFGEQQGGADLWQNTLATITKAWGAGFKEELALLLSPAGSD